MKSIGKLSYDLETWSKNIEKNIINAQRDVAKKIWEDVIDEAPVNGGDYISSIQVSDTEIKNSKIKTSVFTDLLSNDGYVIGRMIENGTGIYALEPHIGHTKTFRKSGYQYWYVPASSVDRPLGEKIIIKGKEFYVAYAQPPKPHWKPSLNKNKSFYIDKIKEAIKNA